MGGAAAGKHDSELAVAGVGKITPEALAAEFPQWRKPARAGDAWITMRSGPQEYHGPASLTLRTLAAPTIRGLAEKLHFQTQLDGLTPDQLAAMWRELRRPAPESEVAMITIDEARARHPDRTIRREGFTWVATDPNGITPPIESGRLDFLDAMLGETGEGR